MIGRDELANLPINAPPLSVAGNTRDPAPEGPLQRSPPRSPRSRPGPLAAVTREPTTDQRYPAGGRPFHMFQSLARQAPGRLWYMR